MFWGQTGRNLFARSVSFQGATVTGGMNLRLPRGGVAKGMPRKVATGWRLSVGCWRTPCTGPYLVATFLKQRKPSEISGLRSTSRYTSASCWISEIKWNPSKDAWKLLAPSVLSCCLQKEKSELNYLSAFGLTFIESLQTPAWPRAWRLVERGLPCTPGDSWLHDENTEYFKEAVINVSRDLESIHKISLVT